MSDLFVAFSGASAAEVERKRKRRRKRRRRGRRRKEEEEEEEEPEEEDVSLTQKNADGEFSEDSNYDNTIPIVTGKGRGKAMLRGPAARIQNRSKVKDYFVYHSNNHCKLPVVYSLEDYSGSCRGQGITPTRAAQTFASILPSTRARPKRDMFLLRVEMYSRLDGTEGRSDWRAILKASLRNYLERFHDGAATLGSKKRRSGPAVFH